MSRIEIDKELQSQEFKDEWNRHEAICNSFLEAVLFCNLNYFRDRINSEVNFFIRVSDDFIQSLIAIKMLSKEGIHNQCRRELRYLLELAVKSCLVSQRNSSLDYQTQITAFEKLLKEDSISIIRDINLHLITDTQLRGDFNTEIKKLYGMLCTYIHVSPHQLVEKIQLAHSGRYIGFEGVAELRQLNDELERTLAYVMVLLFHSIPEWVVGDFLVEDDGSTKEFHFNQSRYIIDIDRKFDYKAERQSKLSQLNLERERKIKF
jgi:hypothetical protein